MVNPGFYDANDKVEIYVDGQKLFEILRSQVATTSVWRSEFGDFATSGLEDFNVNLYRLESGHHLTDEIFHQLSISTSPQEERLADNTIPNVGQIVLARENAVVNLSALDQRESCPWMDFQSWSDNVNDPTAKDTFIVLNEDKSVTANFVNYAHVCGDACTPFEQLRQLGDLHTDCRIDIADFAVLASNWLAEYDASSFDN
jgi:hypothetical protein